MKNAPLPPSRARRQAAVLVLLVGSLAVIATSEPPTWYVSAEYEGVPVQLRANAPTDGVRLRMTVTQPEPSEKPVFGRLEVEVTARWWPPDEASASMKPWLRARLFREPEGEQVASAILILDEVDVPRTLSLQGVGFSDICKQRTHCEGLYRLEVERQAEPLGGVVEVRWRGTTIARGGQDEREPPPGLTVSLTEW